MGCLGGEGVGGLVVVCGCGLGLRGEGEGGGWWKSVMFISLSLQVVAVLNV